MRTAPCPGYRTPARPGRSAPSAGRWCRTCSTAEAFRYDVMKARNMFVTKSYCRAALSHCSGSGTEYSPILGVHSRAGMSTKSPRSCLAFTSRKSCQKIEIQNEECNMKNFPKEVNKIIIITTHGLSLETVTQTIQLAKPALFSTPGPGQTCSRPWSTSQL